MGMLCAWTFIYIHGVHGLSCLLAVLIVSEEWMHLGGGWQKHVLGCRKTVFLKVSKRDKLCFLKTKNMMVITWNSKMDSFVFLSFKSRHEFFFSPFGSADSCTELQKGISVELFLWGRHVKSHTCAPTTLAVIVMLVSMLAKGDMCYWHSTQPLRVNGKVM